VKHLLDRIAAVVPTLEGWCTVEKAQWLASWIVRHKCTKVVEIGVFGGRSLIPMGMAMRALDEGETAWPGRVDGFDPYSNQIAEADDTDEANRQWWKTIDLQRVHKVAVEGVVANDVGSVVSIILSTGSTGVMWYGDSSLDIVHVDGSHNEAASTLDVKLWWPKVRTGGVMVMDDTNWAQVQAARALVGSMGKRIHEAGTWEVYQKVAT